MTPRSDERARFRRFASAPTPAARAALVESFLPLARQLARRYDRGGDLDDLEQVAAIGLIKAVDRFDPSRDVSFSSYAFPTIVGELKRHFRDRGWVVRVPRDLQELVLRVERHAEALTRELGRSPTVPELATRAETSGERVLEALQAATARYAVSLDHPHPSADDRAPVEVEVEETGFAAAEDEATLERLLRVLPAREREILTLRFRDDLIQSQIAERTGVSQMQVSRLLRHALAQLQVAARAPLPSPRL